MSRPASTSSDRPYPARRSRTTSSLHSIAQNVTRAGTTLMGFAQPQHLPIHVTEAVPPRPPSSLRETTLLVHVVLLALKNPHAPWRTERRSEQQPTKELLARALDTLSYLVTFRLESLEAEEAEEAEVAAELAAGRATKRVVRKRAQHWNEVGDGLALVLEAVVEWFDDTEVEDGPVVTLTDVVGLWVDKAEDTIKKIRAKEKQEHEKSVTQIDGVQHAKAANERLRTRCGGNDSPLQEVVE